MSYLGLIILDSNYSDIFTVVDAYNLEDFLEEIKYHCKFICEIYDIKRPWEEDCLEEYLIDKMRRKTFFYPINNNDYVIVSDSFNEKNIEEKALIVLQTQKKLSEKLSPIVAVKTLSDEICISIFTVDSDKATIHIEYDAHTSNLYFCNKKVIEEHLKIKLTNLDNAIKKCSEFEELVNMVSQMLNLPIDISYKKVSKSPKTFNACKFDSKGGGV